MTGRLSLLFACALLLPLLVGCESRDKAEAEKGAEPPKEEMAPTSTTAKSDELKEVEEEESDSEGAPLPQRSAAKVTKKEVKRARPSAAAPPPGTKDAKPGAKNTEDYGDYGVNPFVETSKDKLSTFSVDVDTGSYTISRRKLNEGKAPPPKSVRVEEFVNFFVYDYPQPTGVVPFGVTFEAAPSPFGGNTHFLRIGVQGRKVDEQNRKPAHLTFLVDVSGSMGSADKLGLAKRAMAVLVNNLNDQDTVAISTYAGAVREVLGPTGMHERAKIHAALENLRSGGSTAMADGLETAYTLAYKALKPGHISRIIVLSDGDANVGASSHDEILKRIEGYTKEGVTLSTIGFGMGNYKDKNMEQLANKGNGNYYYIDSLNEARRIFKQQLGGTLEVIAKDVKIQVEMNPAMVKRYRLVGYENRKIADKDFRNDAVDAGEIGAGHRVTAVYEVELVKGVKGDPAIVRVRHKQPDGATATENEYRFSQDVVRAEWAAASRDFRMAVAVAAFAEKLRKSPNAAQWQWTRVEELAKAAARPVADEQELLTLVAKARALSAD